MLAEKATGMPASTFQRAGSVMINAATTANSTAPTGVRRWLSRVHMRQPGIALVIGAVAGAYWTPPRLLLASALAFASGALITALAFDLFQESLVSTLTSAAC